MTDSTIQPIVSHFVPDDGNVKFKPYGSGLINNSFLISGKKRYLLQKLNTNVFQKPEVVDRNINLVAAFLAQDHPEYLFIKPLQDKHGQSLCYVGSDCWRMMPFLEESYSPDTLNTEQEAFEAAQAFGKLIRNLNAIPVGQFEETIPNFHNLSFRYAQFEEALASAQSEKMAMAEELIAGFLANSRLVETYEQIVREGLFPKRIQHHDTKINNVLFDAQTNKARAVCDLDTLMPGYFISDLGDMVRTYTSAESEESTNWEGIKVRTSYYKALTAGYLSETQAILTATEKQFVFYAGEFIIYMQGLRFLTDFLKNDIYYGAKYPLHNFNRAQNQWLLLQDLQNKRDELEAIIHELL